jgi:hypothetical protein
MSTSTSRSALLCSLFACLTGLSGCSDKSPANVSFQERDTSGVPTNVVPNGDLSQSDTQWTGWSADANDSDGVQAEFALAPTLGAGGKSLKTSVINVEADTLPEDVYAGPAAVPVKPGQAYGVAAHVQGPTCGLTRFVVNPVGNTDPEKILASRNVFLTGQPQIIEFYFQAPEDVSSVDMPVQMGFADNIGGELFLDRIVAMPIPKIPPAQENNVAKNSDFEESNTEINVDNSWGQSGAGVTFTLDTTVAQSGNNSVRIEFSDSVGTGDPWAIEAGPTEVPVTSGFTYTFSAWVKGDPGAKVNFLVQKPTANYDTYGNQEKIVTDDWEEVRFEATVTGTDEVRLYAQYNFTENKGKTIYIDNIKLIPPATCPYAPGASDVFRTTEPLFDHVVNNSLEDDRIAAVEWTTVVEGGAAQFDMQVVPDENNRALVNNGNQALKISVTANTSNPTDVQAGPANVYVTPGQTYIYSGFARGPVGTKAQFTSLLPDDPDVQMEAALVTFNNVWQQVSFDFSVPDDAPVLTAEELEEAGFPADALISRLNMIVNMGYPENENKPIFLDDFVLLPNAIRNGDLEDSTSAAEGWIIDANSDYATIELDSDVAHTGFNSLRADFSASTADAVEETDPPVYLISPEDVWVGVEDVPVNEGQRYVFSTRVNGEAGSRLNLSATSVDGLQELASSDVVELAGGWQEITFNVDVPTGIDAVNIIAQMGYPTNALRTIYLDSFRLISVTPTVPNLVSDNRNLYKFNQMTNGGFEAGTQLTGWLTQATGAAEANFAISNAIVKSGNNALRTTIANAGANASDVQVASSELYLTPGHTYIYSVFAKGDGSVRAGFAAMLAGTVIEQQVVKFSNRWRQFTFDFTVPADAPVLTVDELAEVGLPEDSVVTRVRAVVNMSYAENAGKRIYLDDFVLLPNAAKNGDLEDSDVAATGWYTEAAGSTATFRLDSTESHTGNNSLRVAIGAVPSTSNLWDVQAGIGDIPVAGGHTYYISTRIKGDVGTRAKILVDSATNYRELASIGSIAITENWQEVTFEVEIPAEGIEAIRLLAHLGFAENSNSVIYLDSFRVVSDIPPPPKANNANLVTNSGLESGDSTGWNGNGATITVVNAADAVYSGNYALHVTDRTAEWASAQYDLTDVGLEPGSNYFASVWVKVDGDVGDVLGLTLQINYEGDGSDTDYISIVNSGDADTLDWTRLSSVFTFAPDEGKTVTGVKIYVEASQKATNYYIDDLFVTKVFNSNGGFELGIDGWNPAGASVTIVAGAGRSQSNAALISDRIAGWSSVQYNMSDIGLIPGRTYLLSAWVKWDSADAPEDIKMTVEQADEAGNTNRWRTIARTTDAADWVQLSNTFTYLPDGDVSTLQVYFEATGLGAEGAGGTYFVDDLIITEVALPPTLITNGNFESGTTEGWVGAGATITVEQWPQGGAQSGFFGLRVSGRTISWNSPQYSLLELGLEPNTSYKASVWVKLDGDAATTDIFKLTFNYTDSVDQYWITVAQAELAGGVWTKLEGFFDYAPTGSVTDMKLYIEAEGATTSYFVDDLVVAQNFAFNGRLEVSATDAIGWSPAGADLTVTAEDSQSGQALFVSNRQANWASAQYDLKNSGMLPGRIYDISAWVKIAGGEAETIAMTLQSGSNTYTRLDAAENTGSWVKLSAQYVFASEAMPEIFKIYFETEEGVTTSYYVDSLVITEVEEAYTH